MTEQPTPASANARTILVLDDDDALRSMVRRVLELYDYEVLEAADAQAAFQIVTEHPGSIDLILCDLVLPGLGGREAASTMMARRPDAKILFMSGYSSSGSFRDELEHSGADFLPKPFEAHELIEAVERVLG